MFIVITRMGKGDIWRFEEYDTADEHPIRQYGDAFLSGPDDVRRQYPLELPELCEKLNIEFTKNCELIWKQMCRVARMPPKDPKEICAIVINDRRMTKQKDFLVMARRKKNVEVEGVEGVEAEATVRQRAPRKPDTDIITLGHDAEGNKYGPENNPKRGAKNKENFAKYRDGMTVGEAKAAGIPTADINWDFAKGFISLSPGVAAAEEETAEAA